MLADMARDHAEHDATRRDGVVGDPRGLYVLGRKRGEHMRRRCMWYDGDGWVVELREGRRERRGQDRDGRDGEGERRVELLSGGVEEVASYFHDWLASCFFSTQCVIEVKDTRRTVPLSMPLSPLSLFPFSVVKREC